MTETAAMADPNPPDDSGAPPGGPPDQIDEDLARLKPAPRRRSPVVALAVIAVGGLLLWHLRADLAYAISPSEPITVDARAQAAAAATLPANRLATVSGLPDYRNALLFEPKGDQYRRAFFRLLGTDGRILVRAEQTATTRDLSERFTGRLRRFADIPFADQVRDYYGKLEVTRFVDKKALREHLAGAGTPLPTALPTPLYDGAGEKLDIPKDTPVRFVLDFPDDLVVLLPRDKFPVEEDARHDLERLGAPIAGKGPASREDFTWVVKVAADKRNPYIAQLDERGFRFAAHRERIEAPLSAATLAGETLTLKGQPYNFSQLASVQVSAPVVIPADAMILLEGDTPAAYRWTIAVAALLVLFMIFNVWMLIDTLRAPKPTKLALAD